MAEGSDARDSGTTREDGSILGNIERDDDAKQLRDMADVLYEQGKDAAYIIAALTSYAAEANAALPPTRGAVSAEEVERLANAIKRDRREPDKVLCHVQTLNGLALRSRFGGQ